MVMQQSRFPGSTSNGPAEMQAEGACGAVADLVRKAPAAALLCGFGAGMAAGCLMFHAARRGWQEHEMTTTERMREALLETIDRYAPQVMAGGSRALRKQAPFFTFKR